MGRATRIVVTVLPVAVLMSVGAIDWPRSDSVARTLWRKVVVPGELSRSHAFLANNCAACHTAVKGIEPAQCIACHADNSALLQRQPTAFHARIQTCGDCHVEHQGGARMPTTMEHAALARVRPHEPPASHAHMGADPSKLNCTSCHATKDRHQGFFGKDCAKCHAVTQWSIATFRHPSPRSTECAQCHQAPPSHNMMHFSMMSARIADQPNARVDQCFLCHQTTVWNDIKGVGRIKVH
jgi:hypothetical protein